jgi:hypothetical protein
MTGGTLGARIEDRDRHRFVGRARELEFLERCLDDDPPAHVVLIHGPGGIGKSTLLRELARRAEARERPTFVVEGRDLPPVPDALEAVLSQARAAERPVVLIDTYERMTALDAHLRRGVLRSLPGETLVVICGRGTPDPGWFEGGWEGLSTDVLLHALPGEEAFALLAAYGLEDERAPAVVDWAGGSPLALALAADIAAADIDWLPAAEGADRPEIVRSLIQRLAEAELQGERLSALGVAAIARVTTVDLLRAVLPESDPERAYERLRSLTFVEPLGDGLTVHELVRKALRADLRSRDQERERELRRRIIDHLYERACQGDPLLAIDMAHLIENPAIRWGFGWAGSVDYRIDDVRRGDGEEVARLLGKHGFAEWWEITERFFSESPERVAIARDREGRLCGYIVCMSTENAPPLAWDDPLIGPWLEHARADAPLGGAVLWHDSIDFTGERRARVQAMLGMAGILRSGVVNPRFAYMPINPRNTDALVFAQTLGAVHISELDLELTDRRIECHRIDYGPGGLFAAQRAIVYAELGLTVQHDERSAPEFEAEDVREALRNFRVPHELARSPLAIGAQQDERAESVRALLRDAAERAFGDNENEKLLQRVLVHGYLEPAPSHEQAAIDLSLSRAAYFRRLRVAAERVAEYLVQRARAQAGA